MTKRIYRNAAENFANFDHFKEVAIKQLNEIYGRVRPLDVFDFSIVDHHFYVAVGYYDDEEMPEEQKEGEVLSEAAAAANTATPEEEAAAAKAAEEAAALAAAETERLKALVEAGETLSAEDEVLAANLGLFTVAEVLKASDAALALVAAEGLDLSKITGTGKNGNITKADVENFIKLNAPEKDNANDDSTQQPNS